MTADFIGDAFCAIIYIYAGLWCISSATSVVILIWNWVCGKR